MTLLLSIIGLLPARVIEVDLIEENITTNETGGKLHQIVLYLWNPEYRRHDVTAWWIVREEETPVFVNGYAKVKHPLGVWIKSRLYRFTETVTDPEIEQRKLMPVDMRKSRI